MKNNKYLVDLFNRMGLPLRAKQAQYLTVRILEHDSIIVLKNGKVYADTTAMRAKQFGKGYVVSINECYEIPFTCQKPSQATRKQMQSKARRATRCAHTSTARKADAIFERLESCSQMFHLGMGERSRKKPSNSGSFRVNPPLRGMHLSRANVESNRPDFIDYCKYFNK